MPTPEDPAVAPTDMISSFFWANPGTGMSYEQLKQRRAVAAALASRARPYPKTFGEGLSSAGEKISDALYQRQTDAAEREKNALDRAARRTASEEEPTIAPPAAAPAPAPAPAPGSTALDPALVSAPASLTAELPPEIDAGRSAIAQTATANPRLLQMASLNTGTASDAGQPGLTYGGPQAAGPGASIAERPDTQPPATVAAGRDSLVPTMLAQAGGGRLPAGPAPVAGAPKPAYGAPVAPPTGGAPDALPAPGTSFMNEPAPLGLEPPRPKTGVDTPRIRQLKRTLNDPRFDLMSTPQREAFQEDLKRAKEARDKQDADVMTEWNREHGDWLARRKERQEIVRKQPEEQRKQTEELRKENIGRAYGDPETHKSLVAAASKRAEVAREIAQNLPNLYEAEKILKERKLVTGLWADKGPGIPIPGTGGQIGFPSIMDFRKGVSSIFPNASRPFDPSAPAWKQQIVDTEEFRAKMRPMVGAMAKKISPTGAISNVELEQAMEAMGIKGNLEQESMLKIVQNLRREAYQTIANNNAELRKNFDPAIDAKTIESNRVEITPDPDDVKSLRAAPSPEAVAKFDNLYGPGSARRILGR